MSDYWTERSIQNEIKADKYSQNQARLVTRFFNRAKKEMSSKIIAFYKKYASEKGITLPEAKRQLNDPRLLQTTLDEYYKLLEQIDDPEVKALLNKISIARAISREEFLKLQLNLILDSTYVDYEDITASSLAQTFNDAYYKSQFDYDQYRGFGDPNFNRLSINQIVAATSTNWSGKNYSERIWSQRKGLAAKVNRIITTGMITGKSVKQMRQQLEKDVDCSTYEARRLMRTECAYVTGEARALTYKQNGTRKYEFIATLDLKTSEICRQLDGKAFNIKDKRVGINYPPMHPHCRSTTAPSVENKELDALYGEQTRAARGADGNTYKVPADMTYQGWYDKYIASNPEALFAEKYFKNIYGDTKQYEKYKILLGDDAPKTLDDFMETKYNDTDLWNQYKSIARSKNYIQERLDYSYESEDKFIPKYTTFDNVKVIAGGKSGTDIHTVSRLCNQYGGNEKDWTKKVGKVKSDKYIFDIHWYELSGKQFEPKIKFRKERK